MMVFIFLCSALMLAISLTAAMASAQHEIYARGGNTPRLTWNVLATNRGIGPDLIRAFSFFDGHDTLPP